MSLKSNKIKSFLSVIICILFVFFMCSCSSDEGNDSGGAEAKTATVNNNKTPTYISHKPKASGKKVYGNDEAEIDASNIKDGYVMVKYKGKTDKRLKILVNSPNRESCNYDLEGDGSYETISFPYGSETYNVGVYKNISGNQYSTVYSTDLNVEIKDKFMPFLLPNAYVKFDENDETIKVASDITKDDKTQLEIIETIYNYVTDKISYDNDLAAKVLNGETSGYIPSIDSVLDSGKGICFDYAVVMTAMLRSKDIPTKLIIGYSGEVYHAWVNVYSKESGEIDKVIKFDGKDYVLMDPTFSSSYKDEDELQEYIGDGTKYQEKYVY
ncbi:transglutaminase-like domain-containing protein [Anaerofustis stercorihominis]|uniref:transglutaminase-like domain-containing protein n=1 Tax=Anaerofustis stercorihominis TaxID=214853 RepID=UPI00214C2902|nr:transglutaminase-like domain-containing protein [Anaerofustis stercorihominis]MCR2032238.1 transglutaminase-like domain-containing protein [Anaerofustis stercorihominis]